MITDVVTNKVAPGKMRQALAWGAKVMEYTKKKHPSFQISLLRPLTGETEEMIFVVQCPSLSEWEEARIRRMSDPEWEAISKESSESDWHLGFIRKLYDVVE